MESTQNIHWGSRHAPFVPPAARRDVVPHELDEEAFLFDPRNGTSHHLNSTALSVWRQCDGLRTTRQIAEMQVNEFEVELEIAQDHVEQLVLSLAEAGLLEWGSR